MPRGRSAKKSSSPRYAQQLQNEVQEAGRLMDDRAREVYEKKTTKGIPFAGSKTAAALSKAFEEPVQFNEVDLKEELENDTGDCINKLAYYDVNVPGSFEAARDAVVREFVGLGATVTGATSEARLKTAGNMTDLKVQTAKVTSTGHKDLLNYIAESTGTEVKHTLFENMQFKDNEDYDGIKLKGTLALDERAGLMASVGAAMVVCKILHGVRSKTFVGEDGLEKQLIQLEDLIEYIHDNHGDVITLDQTSSAAFDRMTRDQRRNHERHLLKLILEDIVQVTENNVAAKVPVIGHFFYDTKIQAMAMVPEDAVGKAWATFESGGKPGRNTDAFEASKITESVYRRLMVDTYKVLMGSPRIKISSNLSIKANGKTVQEMAVDIAVVILSLVAFHVLTYANTAALDFYIKLARKAINKANEVTFDGTNNVVTHSVFAPGLFAALRMYGVSEGTFDDEMAFQINTNAQVKELFKAAHESYDTEGANKIGAKMFISKADDTPQWLMSKDELTKNVQEFKRTAGAANAGPSGAYSTALTAAKVNTKNDEVAKALSEAVKNSYDLQGVASRLKKISGFGRRRRRSSGKKALSVRGSQSDSRTTSFGRKRRSSRKVKKASFGRRKKRSSKRKASFGRRRRRSVGGRR